MDVVRLYGNDELTFFDMNLKCDYAHGMSFYAARACTYRNISKLANGKHSRD